MSTQTWAKGPPATAELSATPLGLGLALGV